MAGHYFDGLAAGHSRYHDEHNRIERLDGMDAWILHLTIAGLGRVRCGELERDDGPGDAVLFAAGAVHDYGKVPGADCWEHLWVHFHPRPQWFELLSWPQAGPGIGWLALQGHPLLERIRAAFERALARKQEGGRLADEQAMNAVEEILLWCTQANTDAALRDPRISRALDWMHGHLAEPLSVAGIARQVGCSPSRLAHLFSAAMGLSPMRHLEGLRLERARDLLLMSDLPVAAIGCRVGYDDPTWFGRLFARRYGRSPRAYRRQHGLR